MQSKVEPQRSSMCTTLAEKYDLAASTSNSRWLAGPRPTSVESSPSCSLECTTCTRHRSYTATSNRPTFWSLLDATSRSVTLASRVRPSALPFLPVADAISKPSPSLSLICPASPASFSRSCTAVTFDHCVCCRLDVTLLAGCSCILTRLPAGGPQFWRRYRDHRPPP